MNSMTGFGAGRAESELGALSIDARSVNARFLELAFRLPADFAPLEQTARAEAQKRFARGKMYITASWTPIPGATEHYALNRPLLDMLEAVARAHGREPHMEALFAIPGVVISTPDAAKQEALRKLFDAALAQALDALAKDRRREGDILAAALRELHAGMRRCLDAIEPARAQVVQRYREKLQARLAELLGPETQRALDPGRLELEATLFADKADLSEETLRLGAHLDRLLELIGSREGSLGRQLDFLNQEIIREVNTIGSKCKDLDIVRQVLELKNLAESLKEQLANVE